MKLALWFCIFPTSTNKHTFINLTIQKPREEEADDSLEKTTYVGYTRALSCRSFFLFLTCFRMNPVSSKVL
jgi:hypothetical protein